MQRTDCLRNVIFFLALSLGNIGYSQTWDWHQIYGGMEQESARGLVAAPDGGLYLYGTFTETWQAGSTTLSATGEDDVFLVKIKPDQGIDWAFSAGSNLDDQLVDVVVTPSDKILAAGTYWQSIELGSLSLNASLNAKAIYVAQLDDGGTVEWVKGINGTDLKQVEALEVDDEGNTYVGGYFSGMLEVENLQLTAAGDTDLFLVSYTPEGALRWAKRAGYSGDTRALVLKYHEEAGLVVAGIFNDTMLVADTLLPAESYDEDVFIASYNQDGEAQWIHKAGGVLDESVTHLATDDAGNIYVTGYLVGVMDLHNGQAIQSNTTNSDFYLLKYTPDGEVVWAFAYGGDEVQQTRGLVLADNQILLSGYFRGPMSFGAVSLDAGEKIQGFIAGFDLEGTPKWGHAIEGEGLVLPVDLVKSTDEALYLGGSFSENIQFDDEQLDAIGNYDLFVARLSPAVTPIAEPVLGEVPVIVYPNPASEQVLIRTSIADYNVALINAEGRLVYSGRSVKRIPVGGLPRGMYAVLFNSGEGHFIFNVAVQ